MSMTTETTADANGVGLGRGGRMSRQRKREAVLRLLRGEDLELVSRSLGVTAATLTGWPACAGCGAPRGPRSTATAPQHQPTRRADEVLQDRCRTRHWSRRSGPFSAAARSMAKAIEKSGPGYASPGCARPSVASCG